jgi:hypothetical protein
VVNDHDPIEDDDRAGADRVSAFERRSRWLLRAYPAAYRRERGEEMIGTLLDTTTDGRAWPRLRDSRALVMGGLQARAAQNRRLSATANLRIAVMAGVSMCLVLIGADDLGNWVIDPGPLRYEWPGMAVGLLILITVLAFWIAPRAIATSSAVAAIVAMYFVDRYEAGFSGWIPLAVCVVAVVLLAPPSARPPRTWLWLIGAFTGAVLYDAGGSSAGLWLQLAPLLVLGVVSLAWLAIDARLAVAVATFVLTIYVERAWQFLNAGMVPYVLAIAAIGALPAWLMRRQSAPRGRSS